MSDPEEIDPQALERLRELGGPGFLRRMLELFLELAREKIETARAAARAGDIRGIGRAIHPLRSSSGNVGARAMQELAARIDESAREQKAEAIPGLLSDLEAAFARVKPRLEQERDSLGP